MGGRWGGGSGAQGTGTEAEKSRKCPAGPVWLGLP